MELTGQIRTGGAPDRLMAMLGEPEVVGRIAPQGLEVGEKTGETQAFVVRRRMGPISLTMPGTMTLHPKPGGADWSLLVHASHLIGGKIDVALEVFPIAAGDGSGQLGWKGTLEAHGLAAKLLQGKEDMVQSVVRRMFQRLRAEVEGVPPAKAGPGAAKGPRRSPLPGRSAP